MPFISVGQSAGLHEHRPCKGYDTRRTVVPVSSNATSGSCSGRKSSLWRRSSRRLSTGFSRSCSTSLWEHLARPRGSRIGLCMGRVFLPTDSAPDQAPACSIHGRRFLFSRQGGHSVGFLVRDGARPFGTNTSYLTPRHPRPCRRQTVSSCIDNGYECWDVS
jgi:hypothetical protein